MTQCTACTLPPHARRSDTMANQVFFNAVAKGDLARVHAAVGKRGADANAVDDRGLSALTHASIKGRKAVVEYLLNCGADIHFKVDQALREASAAGRRDVVATLLAHGADVHAGGDKSLRNASQRGHADTVALLIAHGADVRAKGDEALRYACEFGKNAVVGLLLDAGAIFTERMRLDVVRHSRFALIKLLRAKGVAKFSSPWWKEDVRFKY